MPRRVSPIPRRLSPARTEGASGIPRAVFYLPRFTRARTHHHHHLKPPAREQGRIHFSRGKVGSLRKRFADALYAVPLLGIRRKVHISTHTLRSLYLRNLCLLRVAGDESIDGRSSRESRHRTYWRAAPHLPSRALATTRSGRAVENLPRVNIYFHGIYDNRGLSCEIALSDSPSLLFLRPFPSPPPPPVDCRSVTASSRRGGKSRRERARGRRRGDVP